MYHYHFKRQKYFVRQDPNKKVAKKSFCFRGVAINGDLESNHYFDLQDHLKYKLYLSNGKPRFRKCIYLNIILNIYINIRRPISKAKFFVRNFFHLGPTVDLLTLDILHISKHTYIILFYKSTSGKYFYNLWRCAALNCEISFVVDKLMYIIRYVCISIYMFYVIKGIYFYITDITKIRYRPIQYTYA